LEKAEKHSLFHSVILSISKSVILSILNFVILSAANSNEFAESKIPIESDVPHCFREFSARFSPLKVHKERLDAAIQLSMP
jgi:hypothetical protein